MERELFTRNFMTGWVLIAGFLASWLPSNMTKVTNYIDTQDWDSGSLVALAMAALGTPIIGYAVSALVLCYLYVQRGDPYLNVSRNRTWNLTSRRQPKLLRTRPGRDALFAYLLHIHHDERDWESFIEWGRRQHTSRFLGYNWAVATMMGLFVGSAITHSVHPGWWVITAGVLLLLSASAEGVLRRKIGPDRHTSPVCYLPYSLYLMLLLGALYSIITARPSTYGFVLVATLVSIAFMMMVIGTRSELKIEDVERLLVENSVKPKGRPRSKGVRTE